MPSSEEKIKQMELEIRATDKKVDRILFYFESDPKTGQNGLVKDVSDLKSQLEGLKDQFNSFVGDLKKKEAVTEAVKNTKQAFFGAIGAGIIWLIKLLFEKLLS